MPLSFSITSHTEQNADHRPEQSDRLLVLPFEGGVLSAVMDGVGCFKYGDVAAESVLRSFTAFCANTPGVFAQAPLLALDSAMQLAIDDMRGHLGATTCTAMVFLEEGGLFIAHIGDSAAFRCRAGHLRQLTTPDRIGRNVLTHAIHGEPKETWRASCAWKSWQLPDAEVGDVYLLTTDGCYESLAMARLRSLLDDQAVPAPVESPAAQLVQDSLAAGSTDNSTAIVVRVEAS